MRHSGSMCARGSWKIIATRSAPQTAQGALRQRRGPRCPSRRTLPRRCAFGGSSRISDRAVIDLPEPDSPTSPTNSPLPMAKLTSRDHRPHPPPRSAGATRQAADVEQRRSSPAPLDPRRDRVADEVDAHDRHDHRQARPITGLTVARIVDLPSADHRAPVRGRRLDAEAEERQRRRGRAARSRSSASTGPSPRRRCSAATCRPRMRGAPKPCRRDAATYGFARSTIVEAAHDARQERDVGDRDRDHRGTEPAPERRDDQDREQQAREREAGRPRSGSARRRRCARSSPR